MRLGAGLLSGGMAEVPERSFSLDPGPLRRKGVGGLPSRVSVNNDRGSGLCWDPCEDLWLKVFMERGLDGPASVRRGACLGVS